MKLGIVEDYYGHINVIALVLEQPLAVGEHIHVRGHTTDLSQAVESMQIGHQSVSQANPGDAVGIKVNDKCRKGDYVYKAPSA
ncbi:MAG: translation elongation factor-like protein [Elusimicrobia bacterium]|nr:translation elongation factor-like protein [Elusimicrobiota bacterium]